MAVVRTYKVRSIDTVDWNSTSDLEGVIEKYDVIDVKGKDRQVMIVDTGQRLVQVFHSKALDEGFQLGEPGDHIHMSFLGKVSISGGHTFNRFEIQVWTEEGTPDDQEETEVHPKA